MDKRLEMSPPSRCCHSRSIRVPTFSALHMRVRGRKMGVWHPTKCTFSHGTTPFFGTRPCVLYPTLNHHPIPTSESPHPVHQTCQRGSRVSRPSCNCLVCPQCAYFPGYSTEVDCRPSLPFSIRPNNVTYIIKRVVQVRPFRPKKKTKKKKEIRKG